MAQQREGNVKEVMDEIDRDKKYWGEWEKTRVIRRCEACGKRYSYAYYESDPGECPSCRGIA